MVLYEVLYEVLCVCFSSRAAFLEKMPGRAEHHGSWSLLSRVGGSCKTNT